MNRRIATNNMLLVVTGPAIIPPPLRSATTSIQYPSLAHRTLTARAARHAVEAICRGNV